MRYEQPKTMSHVVLSTTMLPIKITFANRLQWRGGITCVVSLMATIYIWYHFGADIKKKYFLARLLGKLSDINNGEFAKEMQTLFHQARKDNEKARLLETKDKTVSIDLYEKSIGALVKLDELYESNHSAIQWSIRKGMTMKAVYYSGWIIFLIFTIVRYWNVIVDYFE